MTLTMTKHKKYLIVGSLVLATATPSFAIFGVGDIVFDPTSYASLVSQLTTLENQYRRMSGPVPWGRYDWALMMSPDHI